MNPGSWYAFTREIHTAVLPRTATAGAHPNNPGRRAAGSTAIRRTRRGLGPAAAVGVVPPGGREAVWLDRDEDPFAAVVDAGWREDPHAAQANDTHATSASRLKVLDHRSTGSSGRRQANDETPACGAKLGVNISTGRPREAAGQRQSQSRARR